MMLSLTFFIAMLELQILIDQVENINAEYYYKTQLWNINFIVLIHLT